MNDNICIDCARRHWQRLQFSYNGFWDSKACAVMPTVCKVLKIDKGSMGKIPNTKVHAINAKGGWAGKCSLYMMGHSLGRMDIPYFLTTFSFI